VLGSWICSEQQGQLVRNGIDGILLKNQFHIVTAIYAAYWNAPISHVWDLINEIEWKL